MSMSRKHYQVTAELLSAVRTHIAAGNLSPDGVHESITKGLAMIFEQDNSAFDRTRFLRASGISA